MRRPRRASKTGRPSEWFWAADVGGTKVVAGLVDGEGRVVRRHRANLPAGRDPEAVTSLIAESLRACPAPGGAQAGRVGIGVAGQVDPANGSVLHAPNLGWRSYPLGAKLGAELGLPVVVANDVRTITVGEWLFGAGRGTTNLLCLFVGTGVGGGAVIDGRLADGSAHALGEVGHTPLVASGRRCHCPSRGCLEAYVSGWAIPERVVEEASTSAEAQELVTAAGGAERMTPLFLEQAARRGGRFAQRFIQRLAEEFATGVVGIVNAFNPERVVLGGKIVEGFPEYLSAAQRAVRTQCQPPAATAEVLPSALGEDAGLLGAAFLARNGSTEGGRR